VAWLNEAPAGQKASVLNSALQESAGAALPDDVLARSLANITFTLDPLAGSYPRLLQDGVDAGTTKQADLNGLFDLRPLNGVIAGGGTGTPVSAAGLGSN
jgi:NitT/TauT family transport system substrate-binding protein